MRRLPLRSPPRVRGKVPVCCPEHRKVRITPAYAGKRDLVISGSGDIEDHPRVCGEKLKMPCWIAPSVGSPPRMRGKAGRCRDRRPCARITPACAGKRYTRCFACPRPTDHPRVCGEKDWDSLLSDLRTGSPPRMRGKVQLQPGQPAALGITPAYAGKSKNLPALVCGNGDPPPRVRGKAVADLDDTLLWGITPAYAGKSKYVHHRQVKTVDHPRVCGEKIDQVRPDGVVAGSPPRVRGKALAVSAHAFKCRITPACAGKSDYPNCV